MKRILVCLVLLAVMVFACSGCEVKHYEQEEMDQITRNGSTMMRSWLRENMPEAALDACEALVVNTSAHISHLTDYACGTILHKGEEIQFTIHTVTGQVYFKHRQQELDAAVRAYLCEATGIPTETEEYDFRCAYMAPLSLRDQEEPEKLDYDYLDLGIPAEVEDLAAFVRDPGSRLQIDVMWAKPVPPEDTDLSVYSLAYFLELRGSCGLRIDRIHMDNGSCYFTMENGTEAFFGEYGNWYEEEELWFRGPIRVRREVLDQQTNEITQYQWVFDPQSDLTVERTGTGWRFTGSSNIWGYSFQVYTEEGSEYLRHDYLLLSADWDPESEKKGVLMSWAKQKDGTYKLVHGESGQSKPLDTGRLEQFE